jgi:hypothetical protein
MWYNIHVDIKKKSVRTSWTGFLWFKIRKDVGCHEYGNETSDFPI